MQVGEATITLDGIANDAIRLSACRKLAIVMYLARIFATIYPTTWSAACPVSLGGGFIIRDAWRILRSSCSVGRDVINDCLSVAMLNDEDTIDGTTYSSSAVMWLEQM